MITIMDMSTGKIIEDEFGIFEDEVLNAEWLPPLPPLPQVQAGLQEVHASVPTAGEDADAYLKRVYRNQE